MWDRAGHRVRRQSREWGQRCGVWFRVGAMKMFLVERELNLPAPCFEICALKRGLCRIVPGGHDPPSAALPQRNYSVAHGLGWTAQDEDQGRNRGLVPGLLIWLCCDFRVPGTFHVPLR